MQFMAMIERLQWFHRLVSLAMVLVEAALAYFNFVSSFTYVIWLIITLNAQAARHLMMPYVAVNLQIASKCTYKQ